MDQIWPKVGNPLKFCCWFLCILLLLYIPNVSNKSCHDTGEYQFFCTTQRSTFECLFGEKMCQIMEQLHPKTGNAPPPPPHTYTHNSNDMLLNLHFLVVTDHIFCWNTKTFKITSKVDTYVADDFMGLNDNVQAPG